MPKSYIYIKDKEIPVIIRNYKNTNNIKMYFSGDTLNISKPLKLNIKEMFKYIKKDEDLIYNEYINIIS
ncbi:MAG: hypothetical protein RR144_05450, partial [Clostridia bacterium]